MGWWVTFMVEPTTPCYPAHPFVPTRIINIIMILSPQGNPLELLTPQPTFRMDLSTRLTAFLFSMRRSIRFLKVVCRIPRVLVLLLVKLRHRSSLLFPELIGLPLKRHFRVYPQHVPLGLLQFSSFKFISSL